ncbi:hypothetical protein V8E53_012810 [Lactarius tabidus]
MSSSQDPAQPSDTSATPTASSTTTVASDPPAPAADTQSSEQPFSFRAKGRPSRPMTTTTTPPVRRTS